MKKLALITNLILSLAARAELPRPLRVLDYGLGTFAETAIFELQPQDFDWVDYPALREDFSPLRGKSDEEILKLLCESDLAYLTLDQFVFNGTLMSLTRAPRRLGYTFSAPHHGRGSVTPFKTFGVIEQKGTGRIFKNRGSVLIPRLLQSTPSPDTFGDYFEILYTELVALRKNEKSVEASLARRDLPLDQRRSWEHFRGNLRNQIEGNKAARKFIYALSKNRGVEQARIQMIEAYRKLDYYNGLQPRRLSMREVALGQGLEPFAGQKLIRNYYSFKLPVLILGPDGLVEQASVLGRRAHWRLMAPRRGEEPVFNESLIEPVLSAAVQVGVFHELVDLELPAITAAPLSHWLGFADGTYRIDEPLRNALGWKDLGDAQAIDRLVQEISGAARQTRVPADALVPLERPEGQTEFLEMMSRLAAYPEGGVPDELVPDIYSVLANLFINSDLKGALTQFAMMQLTPTQQEQFLWIEIEQLENILGIAKDRDVGFLAETEKKRPFLRGLIAYIDRARARKDTSGFLGRVRARAPRAYRLLAPEIEAFWLDRFLVLHAIHYGEEVPTLEDRGVGTEMRESRTAEATYIFHSFLDVMLRLTETPQDQWPGIMAEEFDLQMGDLFYPMTRGTLFSLSSPVSVLFQAAGAAAAFHLGRPVPFAVMRYLRENFLARTVDSAEVTEHLRSKLSPYVWNLFIPKKRYCPRYLVENGY